MPVSKRDKKVSLTKVPKKGMAYKNKIVDQIRENLEKYNNVFVFSIKNMRNGSLKEARDKWSGMGRFFFAKRTLMAIALGRDPASEVKKDLHKISALLSGEYGLFLTSKPKDDVIQWFDSYSNPEYARAGFVATETVELPAGPLPEFSSAIEQHLRTLGMPTQLEKGTVVLREKFTVCTKDAFLTPPQATILKLLKRPITECKLILLCVWSKDGTFEKFPAAKDLKPSKKLTKQKRDIKQENLIKKEESNDGGDMDIDDDDEEVGTLPEKENNTLKVTPGQNNKTPSLTPKQNKTPNQTPKQKNVGTLPEKENNTPKVTPGQNNKTPSLTPKQNKTPNQTPKQKNKTPNHTLKQNNKTPNEAQNNTTPNQTPKQTNKTPSETPKLKNKTPNQTLKKNKVSSNLNDEPNNETNSETLSPSKKTPKRTPKQVSPKKQQDTFVKLEEEASQESEINEHTSQESEMQEDTQSEFDDVESLATEPSPKLGKANPRRSMRTPKPVKRTPEQRRMSLKKLTDPAGRKGTPKKAESARKSRLPQMAE